MVNKRSGFSEQQSKKATSFPVAFSYYPDCFYLTIVMKPEQKPFNSGSLQSKSSDWTW